MCVCICVYACVFFAARNVIKFFRFVFFFVYFCWLTQNSVKFCCFYCVFTGAIVSAHCFALCDSLAVSLRLYPVKVCKWYEEL